MSDDNQTLTTSKTDAMMAIQEAISKLDDMSGGLPEIQDNLRIIFENSRAMVRALSHQEQTLIDAGVYVDRLQGERDELLKQRNAVLDELNNFINAMTNGDFWENDTTSEIYEAAVQEHNEAFWASLPYDIAAMMGGDWTFFHADLLYDLLTAEDLQEFAEGHNLQIDDVQAFRQAVFDMINALHNKALGRKVE